MKELSVNHEPTLQNQIDIEHRLNLEEYYSSSVGTNVEKLENFCKYVPRSSLNRFLCKYEIFKKVLPVHGSIIECGVYHGGGLLAWAQLSAILEPINYQRKIIGFDTFSGIPHISEEDKIAQSIESKVGGLAADSYQDLHHCIQLFDSNRPLNHISKVILVKGDIKETIPQYLKENPHTVVSLLYLDVTVFEPTVVALKHLVPRIPKGGIIVFDELNSEFWPGETTAVVREMGIDNLRIQRVPFGTYISYAVID